MCEVLPQPHAPSPFMVRWSSQYQVNVALRSANYTKIAARTSNSMPLTTQTL